MQVLPVQTYPYLCLQKASLQKTFKKIPNQHSPTNVRGGGLTSDTSPLAATHAASCCVLRCDSYAADF